MPKYITLQLLVDDNTHVTVEEAIGDMMAAAQQPVDPDSDDSPWLLDWNIKCISPTCAEIADSVANETYQEGDAFLPMVIVSAEMLTTNPGRAYWNAHLGWDSKDIATRYLRPDDADKTQARAEQGDATFVIERPDSDPAEQLKDRASASSMLEPEIEAEVHSDDRAFEINFNAAAWFVQASRQDILTLHAKNWGLSEASDSVAMHFADSDPEISNMLNYCQASHRGRNAVGYECSVDKETAMRWLRIHRQPLYLELLCAEDGITVFESQDEETKGRFDWRDTQGNGSEISFETKEEAMADAVDRLDLDIY